MDLQLIVEVLIMLGLANGAPIVAARLFGKRYAWPIDAGRHAPDGHPWLGPSKTWRGLLSAYVVTLPVVWGLGFSWRDGLLLVTLSMLGDLCASFIKRRLGKASSSQLLGLDQGIEAGLPVLYLWWRGELLPLEAVLCVLLFFVVEIVLSIILYRLQIRRRPY